jgi:nucleoside-diphosphate-sugar epimerase
MSERLLVTGAGGFIGGHLVANLLREGNEVRAVDIKPLQEWYQLFPEAENLQLDLCGKDACERAVRDVSLIYNLAADMGGMGFIENNKALCMLSVLVNTHMLMMAKEAGVSRFFYSSSACWKPAVRVITTSMGHRGPMLVAGRRHRRRSAAK